MSDTTSAPSAEEAGSGNGLPPELRQVGEASAKLNSRIETLAKELSASESKAREAEIASREAELKALATARDSLTEARKAKSGDPLVKAGEAYWSYGQYDKAAELIQEGITKGVTSADDAKFRLGVVYLSAGKKPQAAEAFKGIAANSVPGQLSRLWTLAANSPPPKKA